MSIVSTESEGSTSTLSPTSTNPETNNPSSSQRLPVPETVDKDKILWGYLSIIILFHLLLPLAFVPWLFSWTGLILIPVGNFIFCSLGIGAGYHRLLTHTSFQCPKWVERCLALLGVCSLQGPPARWVMIHRMHHQHSDEQPDPHTPRVSWFWGHMGWLFLKNSACSSLDSYERYAKDLMQQPFYRTLERGMNWIYVYIAHAVLFLLAGFVIGWATTGQVMGGVQFGLSLLLYGVFYRTLFTWHVTWGVNSASHMWGYRNFETKENSRNNWLFGLLTNGEGWHNNHHADPRCAAQGFYRWWEIDLTYVAIRGMKMLGLASDIVPRRVVKTKVEKSPSR